MRSSLSLMMGLDSVLFAFETTYISRLPIHDCAVQYTVDDGTV
jgi:hypothetical protein